jgi:hypothetical protein
MNPGGHAPLIRRELPTEWSGQKGEFLKTEAVPRPETPVAERWIYWQTPEKRLQRLQNDQLAHKPSLAPLWRQPSNGVSFLDINCVC